MLRSRTLIIIVLVVSQILIMTSSELPSRSNVLGSNLSVIRNHQRRPIIRAVFSDVDGTLVHYSEDQENNNGVIMLPPSSTGMKGIISQNTINLCHRIRQTKVEGVSNNVGHKQHVILVLVSGMRTKTLFQRLSFLPFADAYCSENGGRIFYPQPLLSVDEDNAMNEGGYDKDGCYIFRPAGTTLPEEEQDKNTTVTVTEEKLPRLYRLVEDMVWRKQHDNNIAATGDQMIHGTSLLWDFASMLKSRGWVLDEQGYTTCFRVHQKRQVAPHFNTSNLHLLLPKGLMVSTNLGCVDVYPDTSGKKNACQYLIDEKFQGVGTLSDNCIFLCDDDNDIELATSCSFAFLPSLSSDSIKQIAHTHPERIIIATDIVEGGNQGTTRATDTLLQTIFYRFFSNIDGSSVSALSRQN